jgi:hypothetical protein
VSYFDQSLLARDPDFAMRIAACVSVEDRTVADPWAWATANQWAIAAAPGFADAYSSAIAGDVENPGRDPAVITDPQILAAVQAVLAP